MNKSQSAIVTMVLLAGIANGYGALRRSKDITYPVVGGFIVLILLLVVEQANHRVAEMFAGAYAITSILTNGSDLVAGLTGFVDPNAPRFDPGGQKVTDGAAPAAFTVKGAAPLPAGATVIPAPTYSLSSPSATVTPVSSYTNPSYTTYV